MVSLSLKADKAWEKYKEEFCRLVRIPSVYDGISAGSGAPYGRNVRQALDYMKSLCEREGFDVREYDGQAISASWGSGERIDIVSHLDVVQVDGDWDEDPFSGSVHDGRVYGRGTQDMKSGAYLTFLALKLVKDSGLVPNREFRLVYGTDEERTMNDMRHYVSKAGLPAFAFTPDGGFPMVNGEKGALMWTMDGIWDGAVLNLKGGIQPNVISPFAEALVKCSADELKKASAETGIPASIRQEQNGTFVRVEGRAAHASRPEDGDNATVKLLKLLHAATGEERVGKLYSFFSDPHGAGAGMDYDLEPMGKLSLNLGILTIEDGKLHAMIDSRYPYGVTSAELHGKIVSAFPEYDVELPYDDPPTYVPDDDPYIAALKEAYRSVSGKECGTMISGGVSYSKVFGHCVTFGTVGENSVRMAHQKNESISEEDCILSLDVFCRTIENLNEVKK